MRFGPPHIPSPIVYAPAVKPQAGRVLRFGPHLNGTSFAAAATGLYRVSNTALARLELYRGVDAAPDLSGSPYELPASLPHVTAAQAAGHTYQFVLRKRNRWNLVSQNVRPTTIVVGAGGNELTAPSAPTRIEVTPAAGGTILVVARYGYSADGVSQADTWLIYLTTDGSTPDPATDTPVEVDMLKTDGVAKLSYTTAAQANGTTVKAIVRVARGTVESTNTTVYTAIAETTGPTSPTPASTFLGTVANQQQ